MRQSGEPVVGSEIGAYRVERIVGRGGMGVVCLAEDLQLRRKVALKVLAAHLAEDTRFRSRFLRESELAASLDHPNIIPVYAAGDAAGHLFLAMRYVEGPSLRQLVRIGPLPPAEAISIAAQIASALDAAHAKGLVHRDVKPSNVLIAPTAGTGGSDHVYLADFGLSRQLGEQEGRGGQEPLMGTVEYAAPEQIRGGDIDGRVDVYALGCLLHECLTGLPPFQRSSSAQTLFAHMEEQPPEASRRNPRLASAVDAVLATALAKAPDERYQNCRDFVDDARSALGVAREDRSRLRARPLLAMVGLVLAAAVAVAGWAIVRSQNAAQDGARAKDAAKQILARSAAPLNGAASILRIDPATDKVVALVAAPPDQTAVAVGKDAIWVASAHDYGLIRVDPTSNSILPTPQLGGGPGPQGLAVAGSTVAVVTEPEPPYPPRAAVTLLGTRCRFYSTGDCMIPLRQRRGQGLFPLIPRLASDGRTIWVADPTRSTVGRIDRDRFKIVENVRIQTLVHGQRMDLNALAVGAGDVWVTGAAWRTILHHDAAGTPWAEAIPLAGYLWRVDPSTRRVVARIRLPRPADSIAVGAGAVWITGGGQGTIWRIDPSRNRLDGRIETGTPASGIAVGHGSLWVSAPEAGEVTRIDPKTHQELQHIAVPRPNQIAIGLGAVWVSQNEVTSRW
jgi:Protein kinase domain